ncbi:MAG: tRNA epoxyqueuosine(34) reductase QueG [Pseudomonadota bacterium]
MKRVGRQSPPPASHPGEEPAAARQALEAEARALGFDAFGITGAVSPKIDRRRLEAFLKSDAHGEMTWLATTKARRADLQLLWGDAESAVVLGMSYAPQQNPLDRLGHKDRATISVYADGRDYHDVLKKRLKALARWSVARWGVAVKVFVDTAPVMEKPIAARAGVGWQGKHTNLVSRRDGSWLFLGVMLIAREFPNDIAHEDHCGTCSRCLDICPTAALPAPYKLDARRCISYLTIEHAGPIPLEFRQPMGNRIYGCDDCLAVCPWNKFAQTAHEVAFHPRHLDHEGKMPSLTSFLALDEAGFRRRFSGSPIKRIGHRRFLRNVLIAAGNSADTGVIQAIHPHLMHIDPVVRGATVWALSMLLPRQEFAKLRDLHLPEEANAQVGQEWRRVGAKYP